MIPAQFTLPRHEIRSILPFRRWRVPGSRDGRGFTYIGLLVMVAIMGIVLAASGEIWYTAQKREKEVELLFIGNQFRLALTQFSKHTPGSSRRYPVTLEELLADSRYPGVQRYLRKIYPDPFTRKPEWGLVAGANGEILGVHSLSDEEPLKKSNFKLVDRDFEGKTKYSEWVFMSTVK